MLKITNEAEVNERLRWLKKIDPEKCFLKGKSYDISKRVLDIVVLLVSLPFWIPVIFITAICIKLSDPKSPVVFKQLRTGKGGRRFYFYKFRTMVPNAEELKAKYSHLNELKWPDFKIQDDPRVTPFGKLLRTFSLDELPQLWNVFKGDMSLVGPRPTSIEPGKYTLWQTKRMDVLPGITGLWQIEGRAGTLFDTRMRLDIAYVERRCLCLDIVILFRTVMSVVRQRGSF